MGFFYFLVYFVYLDAKSSKMNKFTVSTTKTKPAAWRWERKLKKTWCSFRKPQNHFIYFLLEFSEDTKD